MARGFNEASMSRLAFGQNAVNTTTFQSFQDWYGFYKTNIPVKIRWKPSVLGRMSSESGESGWVTEKTPERNGVTCS